MTNYDSFSLCHLADIFFAMHAGAIVLTLGFAGAAKKNRFTNTTSKKELEESLAKWFVGARDRGGNRLKRARKELQKSNRNLSAVATVLQTLDIFVYFLHILHVFEYTRFNINIVVVDLLV